MKIGMFIRLRGSVLFSFPFRLGVRRKLKTYQLRYFWWRSVYRRYLCSDVP
jgi:hypothetical protein